MTWFGAALLAGVNVNPDRTLAGNQGDDFNWYQHWYAPAPGPFSVMNARKWAPVDDGWAVGAGVTIGSSDGKAWSLRALLAVDRARPGRDHRGAAPPPARPASRTAGRRAPPRFAA